MQVSRICHERNGVVAMITLGDLEFTKDECDIDTVGGTYIGITLEKANEILAAKLERARKMIRYRGKWVDEDSLADDGTFLPTARLVCVQEIESEDERDARMAAMINGTK